MRINKTFNKFTLLVLGILLIQVAFAQKHYFPGYIIDLEGDTIHGFIHARHWDKNPDKLLFKEKTETETTIYSPLDISGFSVQDERYINGIVQNEVSPYKSFELDYDSEVELEYDTVFLQTLILGPYSLYHYRNSDSKDQFYLQTDSTFELLIYKKYLKGQEGNSYTAENNTYRGQLIFYFKDCPSIYEKANALKYSKNSLKKFFSFYYKCTQKQIKFQNKPEKLPSDFGIIAGVSITNLKFSSEDFDELVNAGYPNSINFSGGIFYDIFLSKFNWKWSINNELIISSFKVSGYYEKYKSENEWLKVDTEIGYTYLKLNNMVRYKYPLGNWAIFLNGGISNGFAITEINSKHKEQKFYSTTREYNEKAIDDTRKYEVGFIGGVGVAYKRIFIEARYEKGNGMATYKNLKSIVNRMYFFLGYKIKYQPYTKTK